MGIIEIKSTSKTTHMTGSYPQNRRQPFKPNTHKGFKDKNNRFNKKRPQVNASTEDQKLTNNTYYENTQKSDFGDTKKANSVQSKLFELKERANRKRQEELNQAKNSEGPINGNNRQAEGSPKSTGQDNYNLGNPSSSNQGKLLVKQPESSKIVSKSEEKAVSTKLQKVENKDFNKENGPNPKIVITAINSSDDNSKNVTSPESQKAQNSNFLSRDSPKKLFNQNLEQKDVTISVEDQNSVVKDNDQKNLASQEILSVQSNNAISISRSNTQKSDDEKNPVSPCELSIRFPNEATKVAYLKMLKERQDNIEKLNKAK